MEQWQCVVARSSDYPNPLKSLNTLIIRLIKFRRQQSGRPWAATVAKAEVAAQLCVCDLSCFCGLLRDFL
jgi:hypothetical protein